jgi:hydrogenase/urease accessory protein HupE
MNIGAVLLGLYALKFVNIPLLLTMRRCAIVATIIMQFLLEYKIPDRKLVIAASVLLIGALIAGYESLDANLVGYLFVWA